MSDGEEWCTIESDPGVFTELLEKLGCSKVELSEVWSLDDDSLAQLIQDSPVVHGLIFLFKWDNESSKSSKTDSQVLSNDDTPPNLFFAHQVTTNACATQAILSVIFNSPSIPDDDLGSILSAFKSCTTSFPPDMKGIAIGSSEEIRQVHNSFSRKDAFLMEGKTARLATKEDDVFHFVAYVPHEGTLYELDGLQKGPVVVGQLPSTSDSQQLEWLKLARTAIQARMDGTPEIKFNLMAVTQDARIVVQQKLKDDPNDAQALAKLQDLQAKREQWKLENQRRQHNYVPLAVALLKALAKTGALTPLIEEAKERQTQKRQRQMQKAMES